MQQHEIDTLKNGATHQPGEAAPARAAELAIVGIGCLFPKSAGPGFYWANIKHGVDCITEVPSTHWNPDDYFDPDPRQPDMTYARRGGFLDVVDFNPLEFGIAPRDIEATDTTQLLGLVAAKQALVDARVLPASGKEAHTAVDRSRISVILGVTGTLELVIPLGARLGHPRWKRAMKAAGIPDDLASDAVARIAESYVPWQENSFPGLLGNVVAGRIANRLDLGGTNCVVDAACASSLSAVHLASLELQANRADVVVTGGCDTFNDIFMYMCFSKTPALSPNGNAKPFDAGGDGTILGEGLGVVVLKRLADAERDGDPIYAVLKGIGSSSDGKGNAIYAPSAAGQKNCLQNAYRIAGVTPDTIELVEAHGTGTKVGDATEAAALTEVYKSAPKTPARPWCAIGSVKSQIGHTKAAAGAASLIKAALALYYKVLPPTIKVSQPVEPLDAANSPFYVNTVMRPWLPRAGHPRRAALSAFGFGGSNFHAVLEEYEADKQEVDWDGSVEVAALSGATPAALAAELAKVPTAWPAFARFAEGSRRSFDAAAPCRLCFAAHRTLTDLPRLISNARARLTSEPAASYWRTVEGVCYGSGPAAGKLGVLFPGQGSQAVGMLRELACLFPEMLDVLAETNAAVESLARDSSDSRRLSDRIYPPTSFQPEENTLRDLELRETRNAQPALGAVSFGAWRVLSERFGVKAAAFAGHSYGELVALAAGGRLSAKDLAMLSRVRGQLMGEQRAGEAGTMLAVLAPAAEVERLLSEHKLDLAIANRNAPRQLVLSGAAAEIDRAGKVLAAAGMKSSRLPVAAAFHSAFVADAAIPFRAALEAVPFTAGTVPVYANTTAAEYPGEAPAARDLLANQLARSVEFTREIRAMAQAGVRTFLEVGPGSVLTRLVEAILAEEAVPTGEGFTVIALDASGGKRPGVLDLGHVLACLAARGHAAELQAWERESRCRPAPENSKPGLTVPLTGANHVNPRPERPARPTLALAERNGNHTTASITRPASNVSPAKVVAMSDAEQNPVAQALLMTQQSLAALQRMQEQTAALHKQFLDSQEAAQRTLQSLVEQQQSLLLSSLGAAVSLPAPAVAPRPASPSPPPPRPAPAPVPPVVHAPAVHAPVAHVPLPPPPPPAKASPSAITNGAARSGGDRVATALLAVVAEKTGYPVESLDLSLSLDGDLGVDSIKRVEILSALQERLPDAPVVKPEHLGTLHTLRDVADFLGGAGAPEEDDELTRTMPVNKDQLLLMGRPDAMLSPVEPKRNSAPSTKSPEPKPAKKTAEKPAPAAGADVASTLLEVVAEKTGYPVESLDLSLSLDGDLGVDSIKRVEILSALQERLPDAPVVKPEHLGTLHTLRDVADFLGDRTIVPAPATAKIPITAITPVVDVNSPAYNGIDPSELVVPDTEHVSAIRPPSIPESVLKPGGSARKSEVVRQPAPRSAPENTVAAAPMPSDRVDRSILQPVDLDVGTPRTRIPLAPGSEIWIVGDPDALTTTVADLLAARGYNTKTFNWSGPGTTRPGSSLSGLVLISPVAPGPDSGLNHVAFEWLKLAGPKLRQSGRAGGAVFVTVARLDGAFGLADLSSEADPTSGGLAGLAKTARHEWPEVNCKAVDLAPDFTIPEPAALAVVDEVLAAGPVEVGIAATHRCTLELARTVRRPGNQLINLGSRDVILITGGARGVTAEVAVALAETYSPIVILTGRTPPPAAEPEWLAGLTTEAEMKKAITAALGSDASLRQVGEHYQKVVAQREVRRTLDRIQATGAKVAYYPVNITDGKAVADMLQQVRVKHGPVTALIHGAGVLADKRLDDLTAEQFDHVYSTKVDGLRNLLDLLSHEELKAIVLFSSTTARFGRTGQAAYACANEVLNKTAQVEGRRRPGCRVVALNWGPWDGGMVTPSLRKVFESEGIGLIPLQDGALFLVQELNAAGKAVEVIVLGKQRGSGSGVVQTSAAVGGGSSAINRDSNGSGVMKAALPTDLAVAFEQTLDVETHPILLAHVLDGHPVLPMALHLELLAHASLHGNPGLVFHGFNDLRVTHGVQVDPGSPVLLRALAGKASRQDKAFLVPVELRGKLKNGREVIHSRAEIVLVSTLPSAPPADRPPRVTPPSYSIADVYRDILFHGPELHGIERIDGVSEVAFKGRALAAPPPTNWLRSPLRSAWVADPLVLDASFQMMILWTRFQHDTGSLPCFAGRYRQYRRSFPADPTTVVIRIRRDDGKFARADVDYLDGEGRVVAQMQDYECVMEKTLNQAFRRNQIEPTRTG
jgi:acyl transferase domain-containing protein/NAD(P)-dependent dehydrogenase (short-subunit alcohol dehydrogenase family)